MSSVLWEMWGQEGKSLILLLCYSHHISSEVWEKCWEFWVTPAVFFKVKQAIVALTDEPCIGGQAGLVIVLVGTGAHCVRSHPTVHHVVSQPRPVRQTWSTAKREKGRESVISTWRMTIHTHTQIRSTWPNFWHHYSPTAAANCDQHQTGKVYATSAPEPQQQVAWIATRSYSPLCANKLFTTFTAWNVEPAVVHLCKDEKDMIWLFWLLTPYSKRTSPLSPKVALPTNQGTL